LSLPGCAFASATNSSSVRAGTLALTANSSGFLTRTVIGSKSRCRSKGSLGFSAALTVNVVGTISSV
jgi:hypothetical protein